MTPGLWFLEQLTLSLTIEGQLVELQILLLQILIAQQRPIDLKCRLLGSPLASSTAKRLNGVLLAGTTSFVRSIAIGVSSSGLLLDQFVQRREDVPLVLLAFL